MQKSINEIEKIILSILQSKGIGVESNSTPLNLDSLATIDLLLSIEDEFNIEFDIENLNLNNFECVKNIVDTIRCMDK